MSPNGHLTGRFLTVIYVSWCLTHGMLEVGRTVCSSAIEYFNFVFPLLCLDFCSSL